MGAPGEITLATLRQWAERTLEQIPPGEASPHASGYRHAARDALAILDMNGRPAHEPVIFTHPLDEP